MNEDGIVTDEVLSEVRHLRLEPGDILAFLSPSVLSRDAQERITTTLREMIPDRSIKIMVLEDGCDLAKVSFTPVRVLESI